MIEGGEGGMEGGAVVAFCLWLGCYAGEVVRGLEILERFVGCFMYLLLAYLID